MLSCIIKMSNECLQQIPPVMYEYRYCEQDIFNFNIFAFGGCHMGDASNEVRNATCNKIKKSMIEARYHCKAVSNGTDMYVLGGYGKDREPMSSVDIYSELGS